MSYPKFYRRSTMLNLFVILSLLLTTFAPTAASAGSEAVASPHETESARASMAPGRFFDTSLVARSLELSFLKAQARIRQKTQLFISAYNDGKASIQRTLRTSSIAAQQVSTDNSVELSPFIEGHDSIGLPYVFHDKTITYNYTGGPVTLSSTPDGRGYLLTDDEVLITVQRPDGTPATFKQSYQLDEPPWIEETQPVDVTHLFQPGDNTVNIILTDTRFPNYWSRAYYLVPVAGPVDTIPPVISNVYTRQDGDGRVVIMATITDNVAVAGASVFWNNQEYPMQLDDSPDRYYAIIPKQLNGINGQFTITAIDTSGNAACYPDGCNPEHLRILYTRVLGMAINTLLAGEPVNTATGNFYTQHQDLYAPGPGMNFNFTRMYNAMAAPLDGPLGFGWTHNYNTHLEVVDDPLLNGVVVTYPDGHTDNFAASGSGYQSPAGVHDVLAKEGSGFVLTWPDQIKFHYDSSGKLTSIEDRNHNQVSLTYTGDNLTRITDTAGRAYTLEYSYHRITRITDVLSRTYEYTYDASGNLIQYKDPEGGMLVYTYSPEHWLLSIKDPNGHTFITNIYDSRGRVIKQKDASGSEATFDYVDEYHVITTDYEGNATEHFYDSKLRAIEEKDANGHSVMYQYDDDNNLVEKKDRGGHITKYTYDSMGNMLTQTDALNQIAEFQYDSQNNLVYKKDEAGAETQLEYTPPGNLTHVLDAEGGETWFTVDSRGLRLSQTDPNGNKTEYAYDSQGNLVTQTDPLGNITRYEYDLMGRQTSMTDANGHTVRYTYDGNDRRVSIIDPKGRTTRFAYDPVGNLLSVTDRRGFITTYEYNENDSLIKETDTLGNYSTYTYDRMYHRTSVTNRRGFTTVYTYDKVYNQISQKDAKGAVTTFAYNPDGLLVSQTDPLDQTRYLEYDALHRVIRVTDELQGVTENTYDPAGRLLAVKDPKGGVTKYEYDRLGQRTKVIDALGNVTQYVYDAVGNMVAQTDARGFTTRYIYDANNRLVEQTDPLDHTVQMSYDGVGNIISRTDARDFTTTYVFDENDNLIKVTDALNGVVLYTYDEEDNRLTETDQNGNTTTFTYDPLGQLASVKLPLGQITTHTYDENGNLILTTNAKGNKTTYTYDELDLLKKTTSPLGFVTSYNYDPLQRMIQVTDAENHTTGYGYDALGRLVLVTDALGGQTGYSYDPLGNLTSITDANGHITRFEVDLLGQVTKEKNPLGNLWTYKYDEIGNRIERKDANGIVTTYTFDPAGRHIHIGYPSGPGVDYAYDQNGNLISVVDSSGSSTYTYDPLNRLVQAQRTAGILAGHGLVYSYDPVGNRTGMVYPNGKTVTYTYDANNWLKSVVDPRGRSTNYTYDAVGQPVLQQNPNTTWTEYAYDANDRLVHLLNAKPIETESYSFAAADSPNQVFLPHVGKLVNPTSLTNSGASVDGTYSLISSFDFTLDKVGNRVRTVEKVVEGSIITWDKHYTYDPLYRLTHSVFTPDYTPAQSLTSEFIYDAVGNRLAMTTNISDKPNTPALLAAVTTNYTYNAANQMLSAGPTLFTYDANGNRLSLVGADRKINYSYDQENRLTWAETFSISKGKPKYDSTIDYAYNALGQRLERGIVEKGVRKYARFLYDGQGFDLLGQYLTPGQTTYYYRDLTQILSRQEQQDEGDGLWYYYHYDALGSVSAWTNNDGGEVQEYMYAPYGRLIDNNGPDNTSNTTQPQNSLTFSGKLWDRETELYYFGARDYDPTTGVWLTQDTYRGLPKNPKSLHRYMYVNDNPVTLTDRYGFYTQSISSLPLRSSAYVGSYLGQSTQLKATNSNPITKSLNGGTQIRSLLSKFDWYYPTAGDSASLAFTPDDCFINCGFWLGVSNIASTHESFIRGLATGISFIPIAGGVWGDNILYFFGLQSQEEFLVKQGINIALIPVGAAGNKVFGLAIPKIGSAVKAFASAGLNTAGKIWLKAEEGVQGLPSIFAEGVAEGLLSYGFDELGSGLFPRGPGRPPEVFTGNWSGPVGRAILGQFSVEVTGNAVSEILPPKLPSLIVGVIDWAMGDNILEESAQIR